MSKNVVAGQEAISLSLSLVLELVYTGHMWTARREAVVHYMMHEKDRSDLFVRMWNIRTKSPTSTTLLTLTLSACISLQYM
jgi:hypothetical protein